MVKAFTRLFEHFQSSRHPPAQASNLRIAIASLIHESRRVDAEDDAREHPAAVDALMQMFGIDGAQAQALLHDAHHKAQPLTSYYSIVSAIKRDLSAEERVLLIEVLWRVTYADGRLHEYEDHFVRKIAHLLYVPNTQVMLARSRARASLKSPSA
jgi:uncharacterized tellurite resistance protein B-like protein